MIFMRTLHCFKMWLQISEKHRMDQIKQAPFIGQGFRDAETEVVSVLPIGLLPWGPPGSTLEWK